MTKILNLAKRFAADEEGTALVEYTVLIGVMLIAVVTIIFSVGNWIGNEWTAVNTKLALVP